MPRIKIHTLKLTIIIVVLIVGLFAYKHNFYSNNSPVIITKSPDSTTVAKSKFSKSLYSTTDPASTWVVVNKSRPLNPLTYAPIALAIPNVLFRTNGVEADQLQIEAAKGLENLFKAAKLGGLNLMLTSGYRSYATQNAVYNGYINSMGQISTDKVSARPGYSEHQTGLAADIEPSSRNCELDICFGDTPEGKWLATNAYSYGFIVRYPTNKTLITGYDYEPWHIRYVGTLLATEMHDQAIETLEEFFKLSGGTTY